LFCNHGNMRRLEIHIETETETYDSKEAWCCWFCWCCTEGSGAANWLAWPDSILLRLAKISENKADNVTSQYHEYSSLFFWIPSFYISFLCNISTW
jgi:hypothetical protein